jgi:hypothetical protein
MTEIADILAATARQMDLVKQWAGRQGYRPVDLPEQAGTVNVGVMFADTAYVILGIMFGTPSLYITAGALQRIHEDRPPALQAANDWTRGNPAFPCFFADGPQGWDFILQQKLPLGLLIDAPQFVKSCIDLMPEATDKIRASAAELNLGGVPFRWVEDDISRLLVRSM